MAETVCENVVLEEYFTSKMNEYFKVAKIYSFFLSFQMILAYKTVMDIVILKLVSP